MRGYYGFERKQIAKAMQHLLSLTQVTIEDRDTVLHSIDSYLEGLGFADALHHESYRACKSMFTFDDKKFARRAKRLALIPNVNVPK
jgi:predicted nucleic-acid-binding protein